MTTGRDGYSLTLHAFAVKNKNSFKLVIYFYSLLRNFDRLNEIKESCYKHKAGPHFCLSFFFFNFLIVYITTF